MAEKPHSVHAGGDMVVEEEWAIIDFYTTKQINVFLGRDISKFTSEQKIEAYTAVYNMCLRNPDLVYTKFKEACSQFLSSWAVPWLSKQQDAAFLMGFNQTLFNHNYVVEKLKAMFNYLERFFIPRKRHPPLLEAGRSCFNELVYHKFKERAKHSVLSAIQSHREGVRVDRILLSNVLEIFVRLGIESYKSDFEEAFLEVTGTYYSQKAFMWRSAMSFSDYMIKAEEFLNIEDKVCYYLHPSTVPKLLEIVHGKLLIPAEFQSRGSELLLQDHKFHDVSRMYRLYTRVDGGISFVASILKRCILEEGNRMVDLAKQTPTTSGGAQMDGFILFLSEMHTRLNQYVCRCFQNNTHLHHVLQDAFCALCGDSVDGSTTAELLATFIDNVLRKAGGIQASTNRDERRTRQILDRALELVVYIPDRDVFFKFCRINLARRLLRRISSEGAYEYYLLENFKERWEICHTWNMEKMIVEFTSGVREMKTRFRQYLSENSTGLGTDLSVNVLTTGWWPTYESADLKLPEEMARCVEVFTEFYKTRHMGRKLNWNYALGYCKLIGRFDAKPIELLVIPYQAAVLLLFNSSETLSYAEIKNQLNLMDDGILIRVMRSLSYANYAILNKVPNTSNISPTDVFKYNSSFTHRSRISISLPPATDENKKVIQHIENDRRPNIDASLVRIMKTRKVLHFRDLVRECMEELNKMFNPDPTMIKKRIEDLINREYLERDMENPHVFRYIA